MVSLKKNQNGQEYLWCADAKFWNRHSPVLFPFVGRVKDGTYRYENKEYQISQHGFARDMEFTCISQKPEEIWFGLDATPDTKEKYPFDFRLEIGYHLEQDTVRVISKVPKALESQGIRKKRKKCIFPLVPIRHLCVR